VRGLGGGGSIGGCIAFSNWSEELELSLDGTRV
jgi:hypothetical protein